LSWIASAGIFHAITLLLAYRIQDSVFADPECPSEDNFLARHRFLIQQAWELQITSDPDDRHPFIVDVDLEAVRDLESGLFDKKSVQEWGLSVGGHMENWKPYSEFHNLPTEDMAPKRKVVTDPFISHQLMLV
jgi:hypothetical protein